MQGLFCCLGCRFSALSQSHFILQRWVHTKQQSIRVKFTGILISDVDLQEVAVAGNPDALCTLQQSNFLRFSTICNTSFAALKVLQELYRMGYVLVHVVDLEQSKIVWSSWL
jgi:hypothetical protein